MIGFSTGRILLTLDGVEPVREIADLALEKAEDPILEKIPVALDNRSIPLLCVMP